MVQSLIEKKLDMDVTINELELWTTQWNNPMLGGRSKQFPKFLQILVGNKSDMDESKRKVPFNKGQALADEFGIRFFETSAKAGTNVNEVIHQLTRASN